MTDKAEAESTLETWRAEIEYQTNRAEKAEQANRRMVELMKEIRESLHAANETPAITDTLWMLGGHQTIFDAVDEVLSAELLKEAGE